MTDNESTHYGRGCVAVGGRLLFPLAVLRRRSAVWFGVASWLGSGQRRLWLIGQRVCPCVCTGVAGWRSGGLGMLRHRCTAGVGLPLALARLVHASTTQPRTVHKRHHATPSMH